MLSQIIWRENVIDSDIASVREVVKSSGFFSDPEIGVACELVEEHLRIGAVASGYHFIFSEHEGKVVGYGCYGPIPCTACSYDIYWVAVHEDYRRKGLGREILRRMEQIISDIGGHKIFIETSSKPLYEPTRRFYRRAEYELVAEIRDFYDEHDHKCIFEKRVKKAAPNGQ